MISRSLNTRTLRTDSLPMRLYEKAKDSGGWNPAHLDFSVDQVHWENLRGKDRVPVLAMTVLGAQGLRAQLHNSATILAAVERHGTIEESLCFSSLLYETARYVELYNRLLEDLFHLLGDPDRFHLSRFRSFFGEKLPRVIDKLQSDAEPRNVVEALTLTGPIGRGVLGATRNHIFVSMLERLEIMPTATAAIREYHRASQRHLKFEIYFIGRLIRQQPVLWETVDETLHDGFEPAIGMVREFFDKFSTEQLSRAEAVTFSVERFSSCYEQLERTKEPTFSADGTRLGRRRR